MRDHSGELFVALQRLLPHHLLSRLTGRLADSRTPAIRDLLIRLAIRRFGINMMEAGRHNPRDYRNFNDFFTRELQPEARPVDSAQDALVFPADGAISQCGVIAQDRLLQAKGHEYTVSQLLGRRPEESSTFENGSFATIYLSPSDYHRVHMPVDGQLLSAEYVPGRLFSVNDTTTQHIPKLFARNERLMCQFDTPVGRMAVIMVGAMLVAGIETVWHGRMVPGRYTQLPAPANPFLGKGEELGRFHFGSTVILLFGSDAVDWAPMAAGDRTRMGERMATARS